MSENRSFVSSHMAANKRCSSLNYLIHRASLLHWVVGFNSEDYGYLSVIQRIANRWASPQPRPSQELACWVCGPVAQRGQECGVRRIAGIVESNDSV
jgi:hypothetical protein